MAPVSVRGYHVPYLVELGEAVQRVWLRVTLAAGAGLVSLAGCSGACVAIVLLFILLGDYVVRLGRLDPPLFLFGVGAALLLALASLSLPALALGARGGHVMKTAVLSGLGFCAFVFFSILSLGNVFAVSVALMALVATPFIGSLVAIQEEGHVRVLLGRASVIAAVTIYCTSLLAYWAVYGDEGLPYFLLPLIVASSSWPVLPAIVASLRSG